jgi:hypothetical protein
MWPPAAVLIMSVISYLIGLGIGFLLGFGKGRQ